MEAEAGAIGIVTVSGVVALAASLPPVLRQTMTSASQFPIRLALFPPQWRALALHGGTQLPLVAAISALAVESGPRPGWRGAALVSGAVLTAIVCPALATRMLARAGS